MAKERASLSPSGLTTAWMACRSVNSRLCTPSNMLLDREEGEGGLKHLRKGWTLVGSRVSLTICRISLFERKKKRGKTSLRCSRYLAGGEGRVERAGRGRIVRSRDGAVRMGCLLSPLLMSLRRARLRWSISSIPWTEAMQVSC
jgi:hypothetical protein